MKGEAGGAVSVKQPKDAAMTVQQVNILLVDDKAERLLSYEVALGSLGHNLVRAQSGAEALGLLMQMEFAAILLDVSMPEMDGFETAALIREHPRFEETPIIFVTGVHITDLDRRKGYEMGAVDYVQIPVIPEILRGKVRALVQLYLQRAELSRLNRELAATNAELARAHEELKAENTRELHQLNATLEHSNSELIATNNKLIEEIGERERAEQELSESVRRKDEYIAILAHELRNPLSAIHNAMEVMQLDTVSEQQLGWAQKLLQRQVNHLTCLMDDLLDVSRISNGRIQLRLEMLDLVSVVNHAAETVEPLLKEHRHKLQLDLPEQQLWVEGDMVRLTQVLGNLLTNAAKYMENEGVIRLAVEQEEEGWVVIRVRDRGVGIPEDLLGTVFDLFVQAPTALNRAQGGLGIGLALVRALVELHGGSTAVSSDGPGCGAEFSVHLPLVNAPGNSEAPEQVVPTIGEHSERALRVVIVDDNADSASGLAICLQTQGCEVCVSHTGEDGIATAIKNRPDVVLLDIGLPDIDGYQVAERLRGDKKLASASIIAMTGYSGEAEQRRAKLAGFDHYLVKPIDYGKLFKLMNGEVEPVL
ncbi:MAG: response regulator [Cellvibrionaceae bacterium]